MSFSLLNLFKRKPPTEQNAPAAAQPAPVLEKPKPSGERMSKTVMPNAARSVPAPDPFHVGTNSSGSAKDEGQAPRTIAFGGSTPAAKADLPPAVALALEPRVERVVSLELTDIADQMPAGFIRPIDQGDAGRRVLLRAAEIERGMSNGKPSVSIASIYQQVPEIFLHPVASSDDTQVVLPFGKVLEQFTSLQLRGDQYREQAVPQVETPFLQATLEDNTRFGTTIEPLQTGDLPPVRVEPATARTIAAAEPEPAVKETVVPSTPYALRPAATNGNGNGKHTNGASLAAIALSPPTRIPFKLSPKGADEPASERVPASNRGPSVPTSAPNQEAPTRIPFKIGTPGEEVSRKPEPWLTKESLDSGTQASEEKHEAKLSEVKISLPLKPILNGLPPFQLTGDLSGVPEDARVELPFSVIEPQLSLGRVNVPPEEFAARLPEDYRGLFSFKEIATPVPLPLHEVLKNLPTASLRMRADQEEQEKGTNFATPFSATAEEDARRFNVAATPVAKPTLAAAAPVAAPVAKAKTDPMQTAPPPVSMKFELPSAAQAAESTPAAEPAAVEKKVQPAGRTPMQAAFETDDEMDAKGVVAHVEKIDGIKACAIMFSDGLSLAGKLPEAYEADGLCAMAPSLLQRVENHMVETKLGELRAMTLSCAKAAITFFLHDNLCLAALHGKDGLGAAAREQLVAAVQELSGRYSHPV